MITHLEISGGNEDGQILELKHAIEIKFINMPEPIRLQCDGRHYRVESLKEILAVVVVEN